jgi:hypothetical protein
VHPRLAKCPAGRACRRPFLRAQERRRTRQDGGSRRAVDQRTAEGRALYHDRIEKLLRIRSEKYTRADRSTGHVRVPYEVI